MEHISDFAPVVAPNLAVALIIGALGLCALSVLLFGLFALLGSK